MIILEDSRQKVGKHEDTNKQLLNLGYTIERQKLDVGDYCFKENPKVVIDTKKDVLELFGNVGKDHARFKAELIRAKENGIHLIILVKEALPEGGLNFYQVPLWETTTDQHFAGEPVSTMNPVTVNKTITTMAHKYGCTFAFCPPEITGQAIVEFLNENYKLGE